jgi:lipopolysaccharide assembly protein A
MRPAANRRLPAEAQDYPQPHTRNEAGGPAGAGDLPSGSSSSMMSVVRWLVGAALFLALLFLSLDNAEVVTLRFFRVATWQAPLVFIVFVTFVAGVAIGLAAGALRNTRLKRQLKRMRREAAREVLPAPAPHGATPAKAAPSPDGQPPFGIG